MTPKITIPSNNTDQFVCVQGVFYRSVNETALNDVLTGSTQHGRYASDCQRVLYLSATEKGVAAAMKAHTNANSPTRRLVEIHVSADKIFDLRDKKACAKFNIDLADTQTPWQDIAQSGGIPRSWLVADKIRKMGAYGLIDPSRNAAGLWHLVLFCWNGRNCQTVKVCTTLPPAQTLL